MGLLITPEEQHYGTLLPVGDHIAEITECGMELSKENSADLWVDQNEQIKIVLKNKDGMITYWINTKAYKNKSDYAGGVAPKGFEFRQFDDKGEEFLVNIKTNRRVECTPDQERSIKLMRSVKQLAFLCGFTKPVSLDEIMLEAVNTTVGVSVRLNKRGTLEAYKLIPADKVAIEA